MEPIDLTEALILEHSLPETFRRGEDYFEGGAVLSLTRQGDDLLAEVMGSRGTSYRISIAFQPTTIEASCSCPYASGGWCKHIVATLLAYLERTDSIDERPRLEDSLGRLDRDQLQALVLKIVRQEPAMADVIEAQISLLQHGSVGQHTANRPTQSQPTPIDAGAYRRNVHAIVHGLDHMRRSDAYWHVGEVALGVSGIVEDAWQLIRQGDALGALAVLDAITSAYFDEWAYLDDSNGEASAIFYELGPAWTEALLIGELTPNVRGDWAHRLDVWSSELVDYGVESFWEAVEAARQGWDHPVIQAVLRGEYTQGVAEEALDDIDDADSQMDDLFYPPLITARLNVLERLGRHEDFLRIALFAHRHAPYAAMLAQLGRIDEAANHAREHLRDQGDILIVVQALWDQGARDEALALAEHGIALPVTSHFWQAQPSLAV